MDGVCWRRTGLRLRLSLESFSGAALGWGGVGCILWVFEDLM